MHIDRISNPTTYIEYIARRSNSFGDKNDIYRRKSSDNFVQPLECSKSEENNLKHELNTSKTERNTPGKIVNEHELKLNHFQNGDIKQEDLPTDLSSKKLESKVMEKREEANHLPKDAPIDSYANRKQLRKNSAEFTSVSPDPLRCSQCTLILPNIEAFRDHLRNHLVRGELKNFVCFQCGLTFTKQNEYELHISSHFLISTTDYTCSFGCNTHFVNAESMQKHLYDAHAQNVWKCGICYEIFESKVTIQIHFAVTHSNKEDTFRCSACMESFETENDFKNHVRTQHSLMFSLPSLQCSLCRTVCSSELEMHFHMATHSRQGIPYTGTEGFLLERHMQTHHCLPEKDSLTPYKIDSLNNNMFDYSYAAKKLYPFSTASGSTKLFDSLNNIPSSSSTSSLKLPPPNLYELYDNIGKTFSQQNLSKHFSNISKSFSEHLDSQQFSKPFPEHLPEIPSFRNLHKSEYASKSFLRSNLPVFSSPTSAESHSSTADQSYNEKKNSDDTQFSCIICDRKNFQSELEMLTHQKITHNMKTGVSLNCAYCNDNFRSR